MGANAISHGRDIYFSTYQAIARDENRPGLYKEFAPDFFDLIIIDECHRGSARSDSTWREILEWFEPAYQLGMTAIEGARLWFERGLTRPQALLDATESYFADQDLHGQRAEPIDPEFAGIAPYRGVGGNLVEFTVTSAGVTSRVVREWGDRVGEPIGGYSETETMNEFV